jgi:hypothetical protein
MADVGWLGKILSAFGLPVAAWTGVLVLAVHLYKVRNERLRDLETEKGGHSGRLLAEIARLDKRCDDLQTDVDECRTREGEWMKRAISAEAALLGKGHAQQEAQMIVSKERTKDSGNGK